MNKRAIIRRIKFTIKDLRKIINNKLVARLIKLKRWHN